MATVTPIDEIRLSHRAALFEGGDQIGVSIFVTTYQNGEGARPGLDHERLGATRRCG